MFCYYLIISFGYLLNLIKDWNASPQQATDPNSIAPFKTPFSRMAILHATTEPDPITDCGNAFQS